MDNETKEILTRLEARIRALEEAAAIRTMMEEFERIPRDL